MKRQIAITLIAAMLTLTVACGNQNEVASTGDEVVSETETSNEEVLEESEPVSEQDATSNVSLPAYEYPGPELFYSVLYKYIIDEFSSQYDTADVGIPCPIIVYEDESDNNDIKVYGDFWYLNYNLNGEILENVSGGSYPGCIHLKFEDGEYVVTGMDMVEDGSNFDSSAKEIFGEHYDDFMKAYSDDTSRNEIRAQIISNYVFANQLNITAYQDYGWDPVTLPEQNIDSFYSNL